MDSFPTFQLALPDQVKSSTVKLRHHQERHRTHGFVSNALDTSDATSKEELESVTELANNGLNQ